MEPLFNQMVRLNADNTSQLSRIAIAFSTINAHCVRSLAALPLKKIRLVHTNMYADVHGNALVHLIKTKAKSLEDIDLSNNKLGTNYERGTHNQTDNWLTELSDALAGCAHLKSLSLNCAKEFTVHQSLKFIRRLKLNNVTLQRFEFSYFFDDKPNDNYMSSEVIEYMQFIAAEMQLKNQCREFKNEGTTHLRFQNLHTLYQNQIQHLSKQIKQTISKKSIKPTNIQWTNKHQELFSLAENGDYARFHHTWAAWKQEHDYTAESIDMHLGIMLDWLDECLLFYANSITLFNLPNDAWAKFFPAEEIKIPGYEMQLEILLEDASKQNLANEHFKAMM